MKYPNSGLGLFLDISALVRAKEGGLTLESDEGETLKTSALESL